MTGQLDQDQLTSAQRAVLDAWPAYEAVAAVSWMTVDKVVRTLCDAPSLADLADDDARELAALLRHLTARLRVLPARAGAAAARGRA